MSMKFRLVDSQSALATEEALQKVAIRCHGRAGCPGPDLPRSREQPGRGRYQASIVRNRRVGCRCVPVGQEREGPRRSRWRGKQGIVPEECHGEGIVPRQVLNDAWQNPGLAELLEMKGRPASGNESGCVRRLPGELGEQTRLKLPRCLEVGRCQVFQTPLEAFPGIMGARDRLAKESSRGGWIPFEKDGPDVARHACVSENDTGCHGA